MGGHASFALGMALARPEERIVLFDSEGDILMNLGALVTIAEKSPRNLYHFVLDNEVYATTGGQPVPNAQNVAYDIIAKGAGYRSTYTFDNLEDFSNNIEKILSEPGPVFVAMKVFPEIENEPINSRRRWRTRSTGQVVNDIKQELGVA
jgi:thiamine pyrophosphate-dependent acetolactate synthase large subunit-like protein